MSSQNNNFISLAEFIRQLKADLAPRDDHDAPLFYIDSIEIEAQVAVSREQAGEAGLKLSILNFGAEAGVSTKHERIDTQTLRMTLSPLFSKEELLAKLSGEQKADLQERATQTVFRGGGPKVNISTSRGPMRGG